MSLIKFFALKPLTALLAAGLICTTLAAWGSGDSKLATIHESIKKEFTAVQHIDSTQLALMPPAKVVIFDVREQSEFDISHLAGAIRVSPDISAHQFIDAHAEKTSGKTLIFYCSVGQRSSNLADRLRIGLSDSATGRIYNLQGGIFNWHNEKRALVSQSAETDYVHPYSSYWGRLLERPQMIRYKLQN